MARPKLTIVVPVFNERRTLPLVLERVRALPVDKEILVIDNASTDGTREWLLQERSRLEQDGVRILLQPRNRGKGSSVRWGFREARGEYVVIQDADLEYRPEEILLLLRAAEEGRPVVYGSRLLEWPHHLPTPVNSLFMFGRVVINDIFRWLYRREVTDVATCYKLMRTDIAQSLPLRGTGFELDFELTAQLVKRGYPIHEVPISYHPRSIAEGKKLRVTDGLRAVWTLLRCWLQPTPTRGGRG